LSFYLTFLGAPGCGKGTQTKKLSSYFNLPIVGMGDLIRSEINEKSILGNKIKESVSKGNLVADDITTELFENAIDEELMAKGVVVDGYPRTLGQSKSFKLVFLNKKFPIKVIYFETSFEVIKTRLLGRLLCSNCGSVFHSQFNPSTRPDQCDGCQGALITRSDDNDASIKNRYAVFLKETEPILTYFSDYIVRIDANQAPNEVFNDLLDVLVCTKA
jgi:adenylate kinase